MTNIHVKSKKVISAPANINPTALAKLFKIFRCAAAESAFIMVVLLARAYARLYSSANIDWLIGYPAAYPVLFINPIQNTNISPERSSIRQKIANRKSDIHERKSHTVMI